MLTKIIQRIHQITGLIAVLFIIFSSVTGFFLVHGESMALHEKKVQSSFWLLLYGEPKVHKIDDQVIEEDYPPTWEKWFTELHGGRFFGKPLPLIQDILAVFLILLAITGLYISLKKWQFKRRLRKLNPVSNREGTP